MSLRIALLAATTSAGCSLVLDASPQQCVSDADCSALGGDYQCDVDVCVEVVQADTGPGDSGGAITGGLSTGPDAAESTSDDGGDSSGDGGDSTSTGGQPEVCPPTTQYAWSESIAVVRNACELPSAKSGTVLTDGDNELEVESPVTPLPFDVCLYGELRTTLWIGDNGYVALGDSPPEALQADVGVPHSLGETGVPGPGILPFWDALQTSADGVCVAVEGSEPDRILWVTWSAACFEDGTGVCNAKSPSALTFSVGFEESTGAIIVGYVSMTGEGAFDERAQGQTSITGITNAGPRGCPASECDESGACMDGAPCNYTEVAATTIRSLDTVEFTAVE
ncbi:MAG: hypothetical protein AAF721_35530 [Myxococcota bacterium]